eukprot:scpid22026/ scgid2931/ Transient receptor potential cation channel subfamily V member 6; Calcium transport protein 1; Epithelial calcium channel 2
MEKQSSVTGSELQSGFSFYGMSSDKSGSAYYRRPGTIKDRVTAVVRSTCNAVKRFRKLRAINKNLAQHTPENEEHENVWHDELDIGEIEQQTFVSQSQLFKVASSNLLEDLEALVQETECQDGSDADSTAGCLRRRNIADCLQQRSPNGATALHLAVMYNSREVMLRLIELCPKLVNIAQKGLTTSMYDGQHCLHLAVANRNFTLVKDLVEHGARFDHTVRAVGEFFQPRISSGAPLYWGEHVLAFAACTGQKNVVKYLVERGADLTVQDTEKNNVIHLLCQVAATEEAGRVKADMLCYILELAESEDQKILLNTKNRYCWTPLKMAAYQGSVEAFQVLVDFKKSVHWTYGPLTSCVYALDELDTYNDDTSVLDMIIQSPSKMRYKLIQMTPIRQLLTEKWRDFIRLYFVLWAVAYLCMLVILTAVVWHRPLKQPKCYGYAEGMSTNGTTVSTLVDCTRSLRRSIYEDAYVSAGDFLRLFGELVVVVFAGLSFYIEALEFGRSKILGQRHDTAVGGYNMLAFLFDISVFCSVILRLADTHHEEIPLSLALIFGYLYLLNFVRAIPALGPYVAMISEMLFGDVIKYLNILIIFVVPYSIVTVLYSHRATTIAENYTSFPRSIVDAFYVAVGALSIDINNIAMSTQPFVFGLISTTYLVIATVMLLNLLIAMMSNTYQKITDQQVEVWNHQMGSLVLFLEDRIPKRMRIRSGFPGRSLGMKNDKRWFLRVQEHHNHLFVETSDSGGSAESDPTQESPIFPHGSSQTSEELANLRRRKSTKQNSILTMLGESASPSIETLYTPTDPGLCNIPGAKQPAKTAPVGSQPKFFSSTVHTGAATAVTAAAASQSGSLQPGRSLSVVLPSITMTTSAERRRHSDLHSLPDGTAGFFDDQTILSGVNTTSFSTLNESDYEEPWVEETASEASAMINRPRRQSMVVSPQVTSDATTDSTIGHSV